MKNIEDFLKIVDDFFLRNEKHLRYGQTVMNILAEYDNKKYLEITASEFDCFFDDSTVRLTLEKLEKDWNNNV